MFGNLRDEIKQEVLGVLLVAVTILAYVGLYSPSHTGAGETVRLLFSAAFGRIQMVVPGLAGVVGLLCIFQRGHLVAGARAVGWALGLMMVLAWLHRLEPGITGYEFEGARMGVGGGLAGAAITWGLRQALGPVGRDIALTALSVVAFLLATEISLIAAFRGLLAAVRSSGRWIGRTAAGLVGLSPRGQRSLRKPGAGDYEPRGYVSLGAGDGTRSPGRSAPIPRSTSPAQGPAGSPVASPRAGLEGSAAGAAGSRTPAVRMAGGAVIAKEDSARTTTGFLPGGRAGPAGGLVSGAAGLAAGAMASGTAGGLAGLSTSPAHGPGGGLTSSRARSGVGRKPYEQIALTEDYLFELPPLSILDPPIPVKGRRQRQDVEEKARVLEETLASFGVAGRVVDARRGPVVTRFEFQPGPGVKVARITSLADDIALHLAAQGVRIEAPIPGKHAVGIEVPNLEVSTVPLREVLEDPETMRQVSKLTVVFGKEITGRSITGDLDRLLHVLIAGTTGSGKSVCLNAILASLLFRAKPHEVKLLLIDPKVVELSVYEGIPHLVAPVVTDPKKAAGCLRWAVKQMEERYELFAAAGVRDIGRYNTLAAEVQTAALPSVPHGTAPGRPASSGPAGAAVTAASAGDVAAAGGRPGPAVTVAGTVVGSLEAESVREMRAAAGPQPLPYIVIVIDELADLMMVAPVDVEDAIWRLAQMARAAGIHLIVATQRPSVDVVTGTIKANIPTRVAFAVASQVDSRTIIDGPGAEKLLGHGDMLFLPVGLTKPIRVQGAYVSDREIESLVGYLKSQGRPKYAPDVLQSEGPGGAEAEESNDSLFDDAVRVVMETGQASISMIQRKLRVGYTRAGRLIDMMEEKGIVGPFEGSKARDVMMTYDQYRRQKEAARRVSDQTGARDARAWPVSGPSGPVGPRPGRPEDEGGLDEE